jgi:hypothetical protein
MKTTIFLVLAGWALFTMHQQNVDHFYELYTRNTVQPSSIVMTAQNQNVISGIVVDPQGKPVSDARVYFTNAPVPLPDIALLTDSNGKFSLSAPSTGIYTLECRVEGFAPTASTVTVTGNQEVQLEIRLRRE